MNRFYCSGWNLILLAFVSLMAGVILTAIPIISRVANNAISRIIDGDTFELVDGRTIRLLGVDCPESKDPQKPLEYFAPESAAFLDSLIGAKLVRLEIDEYSSDRYGRYLCYVWVDDTLLVNREIIKRGYGMAYLRYPHKLEDDFLKYELDARRKAIGMWASPRQEGFSRPSGVPEPEAKPPVRDTETVYITKSGSKYHRAGCRYLNKSKIPIDKQEAIARGYSPCKVCKP